MARALFQTATAILLLGAHASAWDAGGHMLTGQIAWERLWHIAPRPFHEELITFCDDAIRETCGVSRRLPSGPLHDAAEVAATGVPTVMMFVQSLHGISHNKIEDTKEEHLELSVTAFDKLADKVMAWIEHSAGRGAR